ncbi:MAG: hypothetical protein JWR05_1596 [Mucilaginibacter sp.]|nr:hypothetical protein [Mucilaginibacter sp.]
MSQIEWNSHENAGNLPETPIFATVFTHHKFHENQNSSSKR